MRTYVLAWPGKVAATSMASSFPLTKRIFERHKCPLISMPNSREAGAEFFFRKVLLQPFNDSLLCASSADSI
jgi:hypothetical protein